MLSEIICLNGVKKKSDSMEAKQQACSRSNHNSGEYMKYILRHLFQAQNPTLTGELLVLAGYLEAHAAGATAIQATQFEWGAAISHRVRGKNHWGPSAPPWDHLQ